MPDPFESPKVLIEGCREDIEDFKARAAAFLESCSSEFIEEIDRKTGHKIMKLGIPERMPPRLRYLASNIVNNLRHALDQATNAAAVEIRGGKPDTYFPFAMDKFEFARCLSAPKGRYSTLPAALHPVISDLQPYGGGNDALYSLNKLAAPNKHQVTLVVDLDIEHIPFGQGSGWNVEFTAPGRIGFVDWDAKKQQAEFARIEFGGRLKVQGKPILPLQISMFDRKTQALQESTTMLESFLSITDHIINSLEAETNKLLSRT